MMNKIGFKAESEKEILEIELEEENYEKNEIVPMESVVDVYFQSRGRTYPYYNDEFDLKEGDVVFVDGKLEGCRGVVTNVSYSFKIDMSVYKRVISVADNKVNGKVHINPRDVLTFDKNAFDYDKISSWIIPPKKEDFKTSVSGESFELETLEGLEVSKMSLDKGKEKFLDGDVKFLELKSTKGRAIVEGRYMYEIEFEYSEGKVSNLVCPCFNSATCSHEIAAMYKLELVLNDIHEKYREDYNGFFAVVDKILFIENVLIGEEGFSIDFSHRK